MSSVYHLQQNKEMKGREGHPRTPNHLGCLDLTGIKGSKKTLQLAYSNVFIVLFLYALWIFFTVIFNHYLVTVVRSRRQVILKPGLH